MTRPSRGPRGRARARGGGKGAAPANGGERSLSRDGGAARGGYLRRGRGCPRAECAGAAAVDGTVLGSVRHPGPAAPFMHLPPSSDHLLPADLYFTYCTTTFHSDNWLAWAASDTTGEIIANEHNKK